MWQQFSAWAAESWPPTLIDVVGIAGFVITIGTLLRTKSAAEAAKTSAQAASEAISNIDTIDTLGQAITMMDRIYDLQSEQKWDYVPYLYRDVRKLLGRAQAESSTILEARKSNIATMNTDFANFESAIRERLQKREPIEDGVELNARLTDHQNTLVGFHVDLQRQG